MIKIIAKTSDHNKQYNSAFTSNNTHLTKQILDCFKENSLGAWFFFIGYFFPNLWATNFN